VDHLRPALAEEEVHVVEAGPLTGEALLPEVEWLPQPQQPPVVEEEE